MPASEIVGWQEYFSIYGWTNEQVDTGLAKIVQAVMNMSGRTRKQLIELNDLLPPYLQNPDIPIGEKSLEQQRAEAEAYHAKRHALLKV